MPDKPQSKAHAHPHKPDALESGPDDKRVYAPSQVAYAELAVTSNFTFLTGASHPDELVNQAALLGYRAIALADHNTLAGIVRGHVAAKESGIPFVVGCRLRLVEPDWLSLLVYPTDRAAYGRLCRLLTLGKRRAPKGECHLQWEDVEAYAEGLLGIALFTPGMERVPAKEVLVRLSHSFDDDRLSVAMSRLYGADDAVRLAEIRDLADQTRLPPVAVNDVYYHAAERRAVQDVLTCIRHGCTLAEAGFRLFPNAERYLKPPEEMARLFAAWPEALARTVVIAERARGFGLDQIRYEYPDELCPPGRTPMAYLRELTWEGAGERYPQEISTKLRRQIEHEFRLIDELNYAPFFLTVHDVVRFARSRGILCQGRGAAANSAVCFCLGITSVDPDRIDVLFERFVSRERNEPPDIDVDFEHERREEVIQYIYGKYGRERAGLTAEVISYRTRSAIRDVGKALGFSLDAVDRMAKRVHDWFGDGLVAEKAAGLGFDPTDRTFALLLHLVAEIVGFPRHLSQHVGGFVIARGPLCELVPIENAAMENRTIIEWDKDDIDALGMLKVDVLALGMLTCIRKALELINREQGTGNREQNIAIRKQKPPIESGLSTEDREHPAPLTVPCSLFPVPYSLATIPAEDPAVYDMICKADTVGVFQIESRAQMSMLPRLKPRCFYDLVIEVAIVRPGPIVGDMVHPYLRRRNREEVPDYPDATIKKILRKTLGVPLFQEQAMALAIAAAGFTPGQAEMLRRTLSAWKRHGRDALEGHRAGFIQGMISRGYERAFAEICFKRLEGFGEYGFPESHSASFALLVYASAWLKCHHPAAFAAALLNSQPMGFYAPAQIVRDARDHGVTVRPVDVNHSAWDCTLEDEGRALRLGMRMVRGLREAEAHAIARAVAGSRPFSSVLDLWRASEVRADALHALALADAFGSMALDRQQALWAVQSLHGSRRTSGLPLFDAPWRGPEAQPTTDRLPAPSAGSEVVRDYRACGLSLKAHPLALVRESLKQRRILTAAEIRDDRRCPHGRTAAVAGMVLFRQRPGTAKGVLFMTLEDETGRADLIVRPQVYERCQTPAIYSQFVIARGRVERDQGVVHMLVSQLEELIYQPGPLPSLSRDFH